VSGWRNADVENVRFPSSDPQGWVFTKVSSIELAMVHDVGMVGLAVTMNVAPVEPGSDVAVLAHLQ
jgi:hypothetical protein